MTWIFETGDADPKELELEAGFAELFVRAGGRISLADWKEMDSLDAMALVLAADRVRVQQIMDEQASRTPEGAAKVFSQIDDGELQKALNLRAVTARAVWRRQGAEAENQG